MEIYHSGSGGKGTLLTDKYLAMLMWACLPCVFQVFGRAQTQIVEVDKAACEA